MQESAIILPEKVVERSMSSAIDFERAFGQLLTGEQLQEVAHYSIEGLRGITCPFGL